MAARRTNAKAASPTTSRHSALAPPDGQELLDAVLLADHPAAHPQSDPTLPPIDPALATIAPPIIVGRPIKLMPLIKEFKILTKDMRIVRLGDVMNYAQIDFVHKCERQLAAKGQIRIAVLKARQIGISTVIEAICFALSMLFENFKSLIIAHEDKASTNILGMTRRYWETYTFRGFHEERYGGQKHLAWDNKSDIDIATAKNVGAGRSQTIHFLHASEVAFWPDPETLMTGLSNSIPTFGMNCVFIESTANGVGNFFHLTCNEAMKGDSEYEFCFYPWYKHPEYTSAYLAPGEIAKYSLDKLDEEEQRLRDVYGVDDSRLLYRRWYIVNKCQSDVEKFHQEMPTTPHEAFISTGRNVLPLMQLLDHYQPWEGRRGRLIYDRGRVKFVDDPNGWLRVFREPSDDADWGVYLAGADPTHTTAGDYACIQVINRRTLEQVAVYRRKIDPINFGKDCQLVAKFFNHAFLAPEKTGPGYATVGCIVGDFYPHVYQTQNVAKMQGLPTTDVYGWATNRETKHLAIAHLLRAIMEPVQTVGDQTYGLIIHDEVTLLEIRDYVTTADGQGYENSDGSEYDDGVMAFAIALAVHNIEPPPSAYEMVQEHLMAPQLPPTANGITSGHDQPIDRLAQLEKKVRSAARGEGSEQITDSDQEGTNEAPWESWGRPREQGE